MNSLISFHIYMYMRWSILKTRFYFLFKFPMDMRPEIRRVMKIGIIIIIIIFYVNTLILCVILNNQLLYSSFLVQVICKNYCLTHLELVFSSCTWKIMHMEKNAFILLWQRFRERGWLFDSKYLVVEEKMTMFFMTLSHNL